MSDHIFDVVSADDLIAQLEGAHLAPFLRARKSTLGGSERVSVIVTLSLDPRESWANGILENSRYLKLHVHRDGTMEEIARGHREQKRFRKTRAKSVADVVDKIEKYVREVG